MKNIYFALILLSGMVSQAQKYELGKVTIEQLEEKVCPKDTSAAAAILFKSGVVAFDYSPEKGFVMVTKVKTRIKIYKKDGYEWANQKVRYYIGSGESTEKISFSDAVTYNLVNGKIEKSKLKNDGEFDEKVNKYWALKKITMPNVKEGSIIEYEYEIVSPNIGTIDEWDFQATIPVVHCEYKTYIPEYYVYNAVQKGFVFPKKTEVKNTKTIVRINKERQGGLATTTNYSEDKIEYLETQTTYFAENVPALKEESYVNNIRNYISSITLELSMTRFPNAPYKTYSTDWETVAKTIYDYDDFGSELNKTGYFEQDIDLILKGTVSRDEKISAVFNYVKSRMNWNEYNGYTCDTGVKKAYQDKVGNVAEINLMLTAILRYVGFNANPILVSTRQNGISLFPSRNAYNYVISGIELDNQVVLLDATNKYSLPNILPVRVLNWFGRIIRKNGSSAMIDLMPKTNSKDVLNILATISEQGVVSGKIRDQYFDYNAYTFREINNKISKDSYIEKLERTYQGLEIEEYEVQNNNDLSKPIVENYSFTNNNLVEIIGNKMYFSPLLFFAMDENPFKQETRKYPVDFVFPNQDKYNVSITIPEGFVIETIPQPKAMSMPDGLGSFKYNIVNNGNQIQLVYTFDINQAIIGSEYYEALKNFHKEIVNKNTEKIVLKKS